MKNKIYMFDADGVVIQSHMFSHKFAREFNVGIAELDGFFRTEFQDCLVGKSDLKTILKPWLTKWNWPGSVEEFLGYWFKSEHQLNDELIANIKKLRENGITCILATNQERYRLEYMKKEMSFETTFDKIYSSNIIGFKKPDIEYYRFILDDLDEDPENIMFYDDRQENIDSAASLGINAILYRDGLEIES